jgi:hypothetical protein
MAKETDDLELAKLILKGLKRVSIKENHLRPGVERGPGNALQADVIGFALVGKFGIKKAAEICRPAHGDISEMINEAAFRLGISRSLLKTIEEKHNASFSAREIVQGLRKERSSRVHAI